MFKWIKLSQNQYFGFWILGIALFMLQEIPYIIMPFLDIKTNPIMNMQESSAILNMAEKTLGSLCIVFMTFIVHKDNSLFSISDSRELLFFGTAIGILLLNFFGWFLYFKGNQSLLIMMLFIVVLPPLYYMFIGLWRSNTPLTVTAVLFLIIHFVHTFKNLHLTL